MMKRIYAGMAVALVSALIPGLAYAQGPGGGRGSMSPFGQDIMNRLLCDAEGLWFSATFDAKLDAATLEKLKPICQKAADARAKETGATDTGDRVQRALTIKGIGDEMVKAAKEALGANASKLEGWFKKRDDAMKALEDRLAGGGGVGRGPQPTPVPSPPNAAPTPAPAPAAPVTPQGASSK